MKLHLTVCDDGDTARLDITREDGGTYHLYLPKELMGLKDFLGLKEFLEHSEVPEEPFAEAVIEVINKAIKSGRIKGIK